MKLLLGAAAITLLQLTSVAAQQTEADVGAAARAAACSGIEDSLRRLTCFDEAFPRHSDTGAGAAAPAEATPPGQEKPAAAVATIPWSIETGKSAIDDSPSVIAMLLPESSSGSGVGGDSAVLILRCSENTTSAVLATDMFMTEDTVPVTIRIGDAPATTSRWALSTSYKSVGLWRGAEAIPFIRSLSDNARLVVRIEERNRLDAQFNLADVSNVARQLAEACRWPD